MTNWSPCIIWVIPKYNQFLDFQATLSSNGISEQEYIGIIPEVGRKKKLQFELNILDGKIADSKSSLYYYQSEIDKSKQMKAHLDGIDEQKMIEIREHDLMVKQLAANMKDSKNRSKRH